MPLYHFAHQTKIYESACFPLLYSIGLDIIDPFRFITITLVNFLNCILLLKVVHQLICIDYYYFIFFGVTFSYSFTSFYKVVFFLLIFKELFIILNIIPLLYNANTLCLYLQCIIKKRLILSMLCDFKFCFTVFHYIEVLEICSCPFVDFFLYV